VLADLADSVEEFDRSMLADRITAQEEKIKEMEQGSALDKAIERLDHFKQIDQHLQGTALH
jgi:F-type H+-transporting ATPase subunit epsilon